MHRFRGSPAEGDSYNNRAAMLGSRRVCLRAAWGSARTGTGGSPKGGTVCNLTCCRRASRLTAPRYANIDYIVLMALMGVTLLAIALSYDIMCQWKLHLQARAKKIEDAMGLSTHLADFEIVYGLPVWHAAAHETSCQTQNSLSYAEGVGRTDGEGIERTWSVLNPLAYSTKEMGKGARHDAIENKVDHMNFEKNVGQGGSLVVSFVK